jgi:hypothetical protein
MMHAEIGGAHSTGFVPDGGKQEIKKIIARNDNAIKEADITHIEQTLNNTGSIEDLLK